MVVTVLHHKQTARPHVTVDQREEPLVDLEIVAAGEQRNPWFVVANLSGECIGAIIGNVREVGKNDVEDVVAECHREVTLTDLDPTGHIQP